MPATTANDICQDTDCGYCNHAPGEEGLGCWCPDCVPESEVSADYRAHVEYHRMAPPHNDGRLDAVCDFPRGD